jgi:predicted MFS family arabinose efflux permease
MTQFSLVFLGALLVNVVFTFRSSDFYKRFRGDVAEIDSAEDEVSKAKWQVLIRKYLAVYLLATLSDWLQGPYLYALYSEYGVSQHEIVVLFVAGFGSSMVFGSFIGGMADWGGRRLFVIIFALVYASSCVTKRKYKYRSEKDWGAFSTEQLSHGRAFGLYRFQEFWHSHAGSPLGRSRHELALFRL